MAEYSKIFSKVPIQVPNKSGFDMSHENLFTAPVGTLIPCLVDELLPNDSVSLGVSSQIQLPPMATDFYGRVQAKFEAFFVPNRILYGGWKELITHPVSGDVYPSGTGGGQKAKFLPYGIIPTGSYGPGSLADYLGAKLDDDGLHDFHVPNVLPFIAYHKIWDDWYRDARIQQSCFAKSFYSQTPSFALFPVYTDYSLSPGLLSSDSSLADGVNFYSLRQRNWPRDYFTNATTAPQAGSASVVSFGLSADGKTIQVASDGSTIETASSATAGKPALGSFTIASLRAANALQQWLERNNLAPRYNDQIKAQFGVYPSDSTTDRAIYLGSKTVDVYTKSVYQNTPDFSTAVASRNPLAGAGVGVKYGSPMGVGNGSLVDKFTVTEHGFLFVMFSLVPLPYYSSGTRRYLGRSSSADFAFPLLAGVGDQTICSTEIDSRPSDTDSGNNITIDLNSNSIFGYSQRFSEYKYMDDEVHGLLVTGESLAPFALQRYFLSSAVLGSSFLQIPTTYLDQVASVSSGVSNFGAWVDSYFAYKKSSTLPAYSIPTLGDMKDTHTEIVDNGGKRL